MSGSVRSRYGIGSQPGFWPRLNVASGESPPPTVGAVSPQSMLPVKSVSWNTVSLVPNCWPRPPGAHGVPFAPPCSQKAPLGVEGSTLRISRSNTPSPTTQRRLTTPEPVSANVEVATAWPSSSVRARTVVPP